MIERSQDSPRQLTRDEQIVARGLSEAWNVIMDVGTQRKVPNDALTAFSQAIQSLTDDLPTIAELNAYMHYDQPIGGVIARVIVELGEITDERTIGILRKTYGPVFSAIEPDIWERAVQKARQRTEGQL